MRIVIRVWPHEDDPACVRYTVDDGEKLLTGGTTSREKARTTIADFIRIALPLPTEYGKTGGPLD
jgi:hypothetical protein